MSSRLDEIKARAEAATKGPWSDSAGDGYGPFLAINSAGATVARCDYGPYEGSRDAEFIAHARTDIPVLLAAVEAVLGIHERNDEGDCDTCGSSYYTDFVPVEYPCPTVTAIRTALGEETK